MDTVVSCGGREIMKLVEPSKKKSHLPGVAGVKIYTAAYHRRVLALTRGIMSGLNPVKQL